MKENERKCFKCGCSPAEDPNITLHRFPKPGRTNFLRCELWAKYCFPLDAWSSPEFQNQLFSKHYMLCNKHFKKSSFIDNSEKRLFKSAAPDEECDKIASSAPTLEHSNEFEQPIAGPSKTRQPLSEILTNASVEDFDKVTSSEPNLVHSKVIEPIAGPSKRMQPLCEIECGSLSEKNKLVTKPHMEPTEKCKQMLKKLKYQIKKITNKKQKQNFQIKSSFICAFHRFISAAY